MKQSQKEQIRESLLRGEQISPLQALNKFGCFRLGARIYDLKREGYAIENVGADEANYAVYRLQPKVGVQATMEFYSGTSVPQRSERD